ncbi:MAG: DUF3891 family protein [Phycisphaeraceae bacterium]
MIVTREDKHTLRIVHQPEHATLAGELAAQWRRPTGPEGVPAPAWPGFVTAVRHHDDGWRAAERQPTLDPQGRPHTFKNLPTAEHAAIWQRSIALLSAEDAYAGLLVALHARWLYTHIDRGPAHDIGAAQTLVATLDQQIDARLAMLHRDQPTLHAALAPEALDTARRLLGLLDALSLMLVGGLTPAGFPDPVAFDKRSATLAVNALDGKVGGLTVTPWPFAGEAFDVAVDARFVPDQRYADASALVQTIDAAPPRRLTFRIRPGAE